MFTGIVEIVCPIKKINQKELVIITELEDLKQGDSISVNGICLTIRDIKKEKKHSNISFDISPETFLRTNLRYLRTGDFVNIERALRIGSKLDGHFVTGHIDDISKVLSIKKIKDSYEFEFSVPDKLEKFIAEKGSVAIDGISLTVAKKIKNKFTVAIIPYTFYNTNLKSRKIGDFVNLEVDIIARYVDSILSQENDVRKIEKLLGVNL